MTTQLRGCLIATFAFLCWNAQIIPNNQTNALSEKRKEPYVAQYHRVWKFVNDHYLQRKKLANWKELEHLYDDQLVNEKRLHHAVGKMLSALDDPFTHLECEDDIRNDGKETVSQNAGSDYEEALSNSVSAGRHGDIGYLRIKNFEDEEVEQKAKEALEQLGPVNAYILDLRDNHGGFINKSFSVFSLFCDRGTFLTMRGRSSDKHTFEKLTLGDNSLFHIKDTIVESYPRSPNLTGDKPLAVLVDCDTRSAAEALAGSLKQERGAILVGSQTFGKGVAQDTVDLADGGEVKVVTDLLELPWGSTYHGTGIAPDKVTPDGNNEPLKCAISSLKTVM